MILAYIGLLVLDNITKLIFYKSKNIYNYQSSLYKGTSKQGRNCSLVSHQEHRDSFFKGVVERNAFKFDFSEL